MAVDEMLIGLRGEDNDLSLFRGRTGFTRCPVCGELLDKFEEVKAEPRDLRKLRLDLSETYDGVMIASSRFKEAYGRHGLLGLAFRDLGAGYSAIAPTTLVPYDVVRRGTRFGSQCPKCGRFKSVTGASPAILLPHAPVNERAFVRSDVEFGSGDEKHPLVFCGIKAAELLGASGLTGMSFEAASYPD